MVGSNGNVMQTTSETLAESTLYVNGFRCRWMSLGRRGDHLPVFFLSGAFQTMESWRKFADHFASFTEVLLADLPGMGKSDLLPRTHGLDFLAESAVQVMNTAGVERAHVVSASYGSPIAYRLAQLHPERIDRMILAGVMKAIPPNVRDKTARTLELLAEGDMAGFSRLVVDGLLCHDRPVERRHLARRLLSGQLERMPLPDRQRYIENTARLLHHNPLDLEHPPSTPALVFTGENDVYTRPEYCREVACALPNAQYTVIEHADHLFHIERFDVTLALLDGFVRLGDVSGTPGCQPVEHWSAATSQTSARER